MKISEKNRPKWELYSLLLPMVILLLVFSYIPMFGIIIGFQDYKPLLGFFASPWVGLKWFIKTFTTPEYLQTIPNTLIIAIGKIILGQIASIVFAILLNEARNVFFKKVVQTTVYFPFFLSWVITAGIIINLLSINGPVNNFLYTLIGTRIFFLGDNHFFQLTMIVTDTWKTYGWGAILYIAAIVAIDPNIFEAAHIDGANRWQIIWRITLPLISPTIVMLACLSLGSVLNAGFEQILMLYNPSVYQTGDIVDTLLYRIGLLNSNFSLSTAIGTFKSIVSFVLILVSWKLVKRFTDYSIF